MRRHRSGDIVERRARVARHDARVHDIRDARGRERRDRPQGLAVRCVNGLVRFMPSPPEMPERRRPTHAAPRRRCCVNASLEPAAARRGIDGCFDNGRSPERWKPRPARSRGAGRRESAAGPAGACVTARMTRVRVSVTLRSSNEGRDVDCFASARPKSPSGCGPRSGRGFVAKNGLGRRSTEK